MTQISVNAVLSSLIAFLSTSCDPIPAINQNLPTPARQVYRANETVLVNDSPRYAIRRWSDISCRAEIVEFDRYGQARVLVGSSDGYHSLHHDVARNALFYFRDFDNDAETASPSCLPGGDMTGSGPLEYFARFDLTTGAEARTAGPFFLPFYPAYQADTVSFRSRGLLMYDPSLAPDYLLYSENRDRSYVVGGRNEWVEFSIRLDDISQITHTPLTVPQ